MNNGTAILASVKLPRHSHCYRVYFAWEGPEQVLLLGGGKKDTQATDIVASRRRLVAHRKAKR